MIFLAQHIRSKQTRHFMLILCFVFLATIGYSQTGVVNNGAKMIVNTGAILKISGTGADYTNNTSGGTHGRIDLDGKIVIDGDWINNASSGYVMINTNTDGIVLFNGSSQQNISGSATSLFENITLDNTSGLSLSADVNVKNIFTLTNGLVTLNANNVIIGTSGSVAGSFGSTKMFVVNNTGTLRKSVGGTGSFTFPIGENTGTNEYTPVSFNLTSHSGVSSAWVSAHVTNSKHPNNTSPSEFLNRYWTLTSSGITSPKYNTSYYYTQADVSGTENLIYSAEYDGASRTVYSTVDATNNIMSFTGMSTFADYTGVDGTVPTVSISSTESDPTNSNPIPVTVTFSEEMSGFISTDVNVINGTISNFNSTGNPVFTFDITPAKDSTVTVDINSSVAKDIAGNDNLAATTYRIVYDSTNPTIEITSSEPDPTNTNVDFTVTFSEEITGFASEDITVGNGSVSSFTEQTAGLIYDVIVTPSGDGLVTVDIGSGLVNDLAGNGNDAATQYSVLYDSTSPDVTLSSGESSPTNANPFVLTITFNEGVTDFELTDLTLGNCTVGNYAEVKTDTIFTVQITPTVSSGTITVDLSSGKAHDYAGNANNAASQFSIDYDGIKPSVAITTGESDPTNTSPFQVTITFDEDVNNFVSGDITVNNGGSVSNFTNTTPNQVWTADITPGGDGEVLVDVVAGVANDDAGNTNTAGQLSITYDGSDPLISTLNPADGATDISVGSNLEINFDENVNAVSGNIVLYETGVGIVETFDVTSDISGDGTSTIIINPASDLSSTTDYHIQIDAGAFEDDAGNSFAGISDQTTWNFTTADINDPVISSVTPIDNATNVLIASNLEITFSEDIFKGSGDITIVNATTASTHETIAVTSGQVSISNSVVTIDPSVDLDGESNYYILIDNTAFVDGTANNFAGISNPATWNFTTEDIANPVVSSLSPSDNATDVAIDADLQITFNENVVAGTGSITVRDVATSSVHYTVGAGSVTITDNVVTISPTTFEGETAYYVEIDADAFKDASDNYYAGISGSTLWNFTTEDITDPTVTISTGALSPTNSSPFSVTITFNEVMTGFEVGDIVVTNGSASNLNTSDNKVFTANITPTSEGDVMIEIPVGVATDVAGNGNEASNQITVEYDSTSPGVTISGPSGPIANDFDVTITFDEGIIDLLSTNISVGNGSVSSLINQTEAISWIATITPTSDGTVSVEILDDEVTDTAGNGNIASNQFTIAYDGSGPEVTALSPVNGATGVSFDSNLEITFDENVNLNGGYFLHIFESGVGEIESFDVSTLTGDGTSVITINPSDFTSETTYYIEIDAQAFTDDLGNGYAGMSSGEWEFTIEDNTNPTVTGLNPADGTIDVAVNSNLEMTFSEDVSKNVGSVVIMNADADLEHETIDVATGPVTVVNNVVTINPVNDFIGETNYYVLVGESTFQDVSPNHNNFGGITTDSEWTFTTIDAEPPTISSLSPLDDAIGVAINANLVITFNEDVVKGSGDIVIWDDLGVVETIAVSSGNVTVSGSQVTINPTFDFEGLTDYYVLIDAAAFDDLFSNSFAGITDPTVWNFTTVDASAPAVTNLSPADDETGVTSNADLIMTFDKDIVKTSGTIAIMNSTSASIHEEIDISTSQVDVSGSQVTINPSVDFEDFNSYYILIDNGAIQDNEGNSYPGISDPAIWNFTIGDNTAPTVISLTPADNTANVSVTSNLEIEFDENVVANSGNIVITNAITSATHLTIDVSAVSITGNIVTIDPSIDFDESTDYYVLIDNGAFVDGVGNSFAGISDNTVWNFSTPDNTSPIILTLSPADDATDVDVNTNLQVTFSEPVIANTGLINVMDATGTYESIDVLSGQVTINSDIVTIDPGFTLEGETNYYVLIDNDAFHDLSGNSFSGITDQTIWNFSTADITQPSVTITSSASGTVSDNFDVTITFSESVTGFTSDDITVVNANTSNFTNVTAGTVWTITIEPIANGEVTVDVNSGVAQDASGNENTAASQFSITYDSGVGIEDVNPFEISIYSSGNKVIVEFINEDSYQFEEGKIEIYNIIGQKIVDENIYELERFETKVENVSHIYVVKVILNDSEYKKQVYVE